jgi:chromosome segregation ATPase
VIRLIVRKLGFVTTGELLATQEKLRQVRQRLAEVSSQLARLTAVSEKERRSWAERSLAFKNKVADLTSTHERLASEYKKAAAVSSRRIASLEQGVRERDAAIEAAALESGHIEAQLIAALDEFDRTRRRLLAMEAKLNVLEAAANTLDARLRATNALTPDASR